MQKPFLFLFISVLLCAVQFLPALDVQGDPEYLELSITPNWKLEALEEVHAEIVKRVRVPFKASRDVKRTAKSEVLFTRRSEMTLRECLETLEQILSIRYTAKKLHLSVESADEYLERQRDVVQFPIGSFLFTGNYAAGRDFPAPIHSMADASSGRGGSLFVDADFSDSEEGIDEGSAFELLNQMLDDGDSTVLANTIFVQATTVEAGQIQKRLQDIYEMNVQRSTFTITFARMDAATPFKGGHLSEEELAKCKSRFESKSVFQCAAFAGQQVNVGDLKQRAYTFDYDLQTGSNGMGLLDPQIYRFVSGKSIDIRLVKGNKWSRVDFRSQWTEPDAFAEQNFTQSPKSQLAQLSGQGDDAVPVPQQYNTGLRGQMELPRLAAWYTHEQVYYQGRLRFAMHAQRGDKRLVLVIEEGE